MPSIVENGGLAVAKPADEINTHSLYVPSGPLMATTDTKALELSAKILNIIDRYRMNRELDLPSKSDEGAFKFLAQIYGHVKTGSPIPLCLPAFPFKSPNSVTKVLGTLPDRAEIHALAHLNGLCQAIGDVYSSGARLTIISDGLVYNDLLGVPDRDVWAYGETLRAMSSEQGFDHITFSRLRDLVNIPLPETLDEITYVANATNFRRALLNTFGRPDWDWKQMSQIEDVCLTYRGYIKFLETDLMTVYPQGENRTKSKYKRGIEYISRQMMARGDAFALAVREKYKDSIRLSIHPSTGANKLSISPLPTSTIYTTPWHCSIAYNLDGTITSGMRSEFDANENLELVYENGRPSYYREKSPLLSWREEKGGIICEPIYPCGMLIKPAAGPKSLNIEDIDAQKVRALSEINSPIVLRGFWKKSVREVFVKKAEEFGECLPWKFGLVLEVKDRGVDTRGLNNVLSAEWMPFHFDGMFKTDKRLDENGKEYLVPNPPKFQFFTGVTPSPRDTGFTLFSSSTLILKHLPSVLHDVTLADLTWSVTTSSFDNSKIGGMKLVVPHPTTGKPCLRYHEPWPSSKTSFEETLVDIENVGEGKSKAICEAIDSVLHDRRVAYYHIWEKGDLLVSDNILTMHTRSDFTAGCDRELWRIHFS